MANPPKSLPAQGRQLSELLAEQQEPFLLDVYLVERGYSDRLFAIQGKPMCCWPLAASRRLHSLQIDGFRRRCCVLKCLLIKFLRGKVNRKALAWNKTALCSPDTGGKNNAFGLRGMVDQTGDAEQLSPVSVLDFHSSEGSPAHSTNRIKEEDVYPPMKDLEIFRELIELAYTSAVNQFAKSKQQFAPAEKLLLLDCEQDDKRMLVSEDHAESNNSWQRPNDDLITSITHLTFCEISNSSGEWYEFQPQVRVIGTLIGEAIFDDIREDVILHMLGFGCKYQKKLIRSQNKITTKDDQHQIKGPEHPLEAFRN